MSPTIASDEQKSSGLVTPAIERRAMALTEMDSRVLQEQVRSRCMNWVVLFGIEI